MRNLGRRWTAVTSLGRGLVFFLIAAQLHSAAADETAESDRALVCEGNARLKLSGRRIRTEGSALYAGGNCQIEISNSVLIAGGIGLDVRGRARVRLHNTRVVGDEAAVLVRGAARIIARNSQFEGAVVQRERGKLRRSGDYRPPSSTSSPPPPKAADVPRAKALRCSGHQTRTLYKRRIVASDRAVLASGHCHLTIVNSEISAQGTAIVVREKATVHLRQSRVSAPTAADLRGGALHAKSSTLDGIIRKSGSGRFDDQGDNTLARTPERR